jgi:hypothetical protein
MVDQPTRKKRRLQNYVKAETMVQIALSIPSGIFVGWLIGAWLNRHFHREWIVPVGVFAGAIGGLVQMITLAARYMKDDR